MFINDNFIRKFIIGSNLLSEKIKKKKLNLSLSLFDHSLKRSEK